MRVKINLLISSICISTIIVVLIIIQYSGNQSEESKTGNNEQSFQISHIAQNSVEVQGQVREKQYNGLNRIYPELNGLDQHDPKLIELIKNEILISPPSSDKPYNFKKEPVLKGQFGQPMSVEKHLGLNPDKPQSGFFIEAGAADGEWFPNTLYFEMKYNWTGLLVEPNPNLVKELLTKNRKAYILPHCLSTQQKVEVVTFNMPKSPFSSGIVVNGKAPEHSADEQQVQVQYIYSVCF